MVNENQEPAQAPLPEVAENPIISEIDNLNNSPPVDISEPDTPAPLAPETPPAPAPEPEQKIEQPAPVQEPFPSPVQTPEQIQQMQQQAAQYQQVQERAGLQQEAQRYQQQLETQGYMPDQAQQIAYQHMQTRQAQVNMTKQHQQQTQTLLGKQAAAEHFAKKHNLTFDNMATLRLAETPEQMEQIAKKMEDDTKVRDELAQLRKAQVPPQQFDDSQGEPQVAANDGSWLDRYNAGDRSPNATAAAKKLLGM